MRKAKLEEIQAIKCAYADLVGAYRAMRQGDLSIHDWEAHRQSIEDLENAFEFIEKIDLSD